MLDEHMQANISVFYEGKLTGDIIVGGLGFPALACCNHQLLSRQKKKKDAELQDKIEAIDLSVSYSNLFFWYRLM